MPQAVHAIPAFINPKSGTADDARSALEGRAGFDARDIEPDKLAEAVRKEVGEGTPRLLISGGDGTVGTAASAMLRTTTELAILPGGTLNHFTTDLGIPADPAEALTLALEGTARPADLASANDHVFLNTSSVGAYVHFVKTREYLEKRFGYRIASFLAALRALFQLRLIAVELEVEGKRQIYRTPLVFIGVGERELQLPSLGKRVPNGKRGLHVMIVRGRSKARLLAIGLNAVARGVKSASRTPEFDAFMVESCTISMKRAGTIAVDGELVRLGSKVDYRLERDAIQVVCP